MDTIEAAVLRGPDEMQVEEVELAAPEPDEVLVDLKATGVCHTDYDRFRGNVDVPLPIVLGHEGAGVVEAVGDRVSRVEPGDHVVLSVIPSCGDCAFCHRGDPYLCEAGSRTVSSGTMLDGTRRLSAGGEEINHFFAQSSFATKAVVPEGSAVTVREDVPLEVAALLGCGATTGLGAVFNTADVESGASVAVFGAGGVGSAAIMAATAVSAGEIVAVDVVDHKLDSAVELGATHTVNAAETDPVERIDELTDGGVEYAFEFVGDTDVMEQAFEATRPGGAAVITGVDGDGTLEIDPVEFIMAKRILGNKAGSLRPTVDIPRYLDMHANGDIALDALLTTTHDLDDLDAAFREMERGETIRSTVTYE